MSQIIVQSVHNRFDFCHSLKSGLCSSPRRAWAPFLCLVIEPMFITEHRANHRKLASQGRFFLLCWGWGRQLSVSFQISFLRIILLDHTRCQFVVFVGRECDFFCRKHAWGLLPNKIGLGCAAHFPKPLSYL